MHTCYLHIGTEKTGTSSLQSFLYYNASILERRGIWYCRSLGYPSNRKVAVYARDSSRPDDGFRQYGIKHVREHEDFRRKVEKDLDAEISDFLRFGCRGFIISSEHCHSRLISVDMIKRLHDLLRGKFDRVEVVCFLRPQVDLVSSLASTAARVGKRVDLDFFDIDPSNPYYNYDDLLIRWEKVFTKSALDIVSFKRHRNTVEYFMRKLGLDFTDLVIPKRANEALDVSTVAIANLLREDQILLGRARRIFDELEVSVKIRLPRRVASTIEERFYESNSRVVNKFSSIETEDLQVNLNDFDEHGNLDLLEIPDYLKENLYKIICHLSGDGRG